MSTVPCSSDNWFLYVIECQNGRLYTGITNNLSKRFDAHAKGKGAIFTRMNRPLQLLAYKRYSSRSTASKAEAQLKKHDRAFKLAWVAYYSMLESPCVLTASADKV